MTIISTKQYSDIAYKYYCQGKNNEFVSSMANFYRTGKSNPAVAKFHLLTSVRDTVDAFHSMNSNAIDDIAKGIKIESGMLPSLVIASIDAKKAAVGFAEKVLDNTLEKTIGLIDILHGKNTDLNNLPEKNSFDKKYDELYPRTGKIRDQLIKNMEKDKVTKSSWLLKIQTAHTVNEYKELYPKTFKTRFLLLINNRIKEGTVTPKLTNIFKKFKYI